MLHFLLSICSSFFHPAFPREHNNPELRAFASISLYIHCTTFSSFLCMSHVYMNYFFTLLETRPMLHTCLSSALPSSYIAILSSNSFLYICACMSAHVCTCTYVYIVCGGQRTTWWRCFFLSLYSLCSSVQSWVIRLGNKHHYFLIHPSHCDPYMTILFVYKLTFTSCAWVVCLNVYTCTTYTPAACTGQKEASDFLELQLQTIVIDSLSGRTSTCIVCKSVNTLDLWAVSPALFLHQRLAHLGLP